MENWTASLFLFNHSSSSSRPLAALAENQTGLNNIVHDQINCEHQAKLWTNTDPSMERTNEFIDSVFLAPLLYSRFFFFYLLFSFVLSPGCRADLKYSTNSCIGCCYIQITVYSTRISDITVRCVCWRRPTYRDRMRVDRRTNANGSLETERCANCE